MKKVNILIVEDNHENLVKLSPLIKSELVLVNSAQTVNDAKSKILENDIDVLITDIQLPDSLGDVVNTSGGIELIDWLSIIDSSKRPNRIVAVTSQQNTYDEWKDRLLEKGIIFVKSTVDDNSLVNMVKNICTYVQSDGICLEDSSSFPKCDFAIITALRHNELRAVLDLPLDWSEKSFTNDPSIYYTAQIETEFGLKKIICTNSPRMGMSASSSLATKVTLQFKPNYVIMTGIAAGVEGKCQLGDILIADTCWDWGNGKLTRVDDDRIFKAEPNQESISNAMKYRLQATISNEDYVDTIRKGWRGTKASPCISVHLGPIASGSVVLEDPETITSILEQHRKVIGIEMEAYGVMSAVNSSTTNVPDVLIIKSVCDFANTQKNDDCQEYASYTSASYAYHLMKNILN